MLKNLIIAALAVQAFFPHVHRVLPDPTADGIECLRYEEPSYHCAYTMWLWRQKVGEEGVATVHRGMRFQGLQDIKINI